MTYKTYFHNPPHLFMDNAYYLLTASTYSRVPYFHEHDLRDELYKIIRNRFEKAGWKIEGLVILKEHYHIVALSRNGNDMSAIFRDVHRESSHLLRKVGLKIKQRVWFNYWDKIIRNQKQIDFYMWYISYNPIKHGYVMKLHEWPHLFISKKYYFQNHSVVQKREWEEGYPDDF